MPEGGEPSRPERVKACSQPDPHVASLNPQEGDDDSMTDWTERVDAIRRRREAAGLPIGRASLQSAIREAVRDLDSPEGTGEDYNPNRGFDHAADIEAHPFRWRLTEPVRISMTVPTLCPCGAPVRTLKPTVQARPRYCAECLTPDGSELDLTDLIRRCKLADRNPLRAAALAMPGLADALDAPQKVAKPKRAAYTIAQKREAVRLYRETDMTMTEVAEKLGAPLASVKNWIRRYGSDAFFAS